MGGVAPSEADAPVEYAAASTVRGSAILEILLGFQRSWEVPRQTIPHNIFGVQDRIRVDVL